MNLHHVKRHEGEVALMRRYTEKIPTYILGHQQQHPQGPHSHQISMKWYFYATSSLSSSFATHTWNCAPPATCYTAGNWSCRLTVPLSLSLKPQHQQAHPITNFGIFSAVLLAWTISVLNGDLKWMWRSENWVGGRRCSGPIPYRLSVESQRAVSPKCRRIDVNLRDFLTLIEWLR